MTDLDRPDDEALLDWLRQRLRAQRPETETQEPDGSDTDTRDVGLYRLIEEFTALRQELKLQTKSARGLQDQAEALLGGLRQALDQIQAGELPAKALAAALADLDEALDRGRHELEKARQRLIDDPAEALAQALDALHAQQSWLTRRLSRSYRDQAVALVRGTDADTRRGLFDALLEGYGLIQSRLQRALKNAQIQRIASVGQPVDPDLMIVVAVVDVPDQAPGLVVEEIRRGYTWRGRLLRSAEVSASRGPIASDHREPE